MKSDLGQRAGGPSPVRERLAQQADSATQELKGAVSDSFARFVISDNSLGEALRFAAGVALRAVPSADAAAVSLTGKRSAEVEVNTGDRMDISGLHRADQRGPCQKALEDGSSQVVASMLSENRWPEFTNAALYNGVQSVVACPLSLIDGGQGILCLYSSREGAFGAQDVAVAEFVSHRTSVLLSNVRAYESAA
ncbi:MAG TPA: GAF domain-containing protein, partial [Actinomycetota bacterium]|nr:GAF domain-containing protein [Actinomycetota bacterium]